MTDKELFPIKTLSNETLIKILIYLNRNIEELKKEIKDIKYRYQERTDIEE